MGTPSSCWLAVSSAAQLCRRRCRSAVRRCTSGGAIGVPCRCSFNWRSTVLASPTRPISTGYSLPISCGSMSICTRRVGGIAKVYSGRHELQSASPNTVPTATSTSAPRITSLATRVPQMPDMPQASGCSSGMMPFAISVVATGAPSDSARIRSSSAASESTAPLPAKIAGERAPASNSAAAVTDAGAAPVRPSAAPPAGRRVDGRLDVRGEHVHRDVEEHRPRPSGLRHVQGARHHVVQELRVVYPPHPLADRPVDVSLRRVRVEADALMRLARVVVRGRVAGNHHHRRAVGGGGRPLR